MQAKGEHGEAVRVVDPAPGQQSLLKDSVAEVLPEAGSVGEGSRRAVLTVQRPRRAARVAGVGLVVGDPKRALDPARQRIADRVLVGGRRDAVPDAFG